MRYLSVCSGIEAATVAWHPLGWTPAAFSEIEAFPRAVLAHHYPNVPLHGDFTTIKGDEYGPIDLLVGGTPCQDFSVAGLRAGIAGERGNLTLEFLRLAARVAPRWIVWENVPGVLSSDGGRALGAFLGGLAQLGYGFAYRVLDAQYFGLAQRRQRVFVVGYLGNWRRAAAVLFERESLQGHPAPRREARKAVSALTSTGVGTCGADDNQAQARHLIAPELARCVATREGSSQDWETTTMVAHSLRAEGFDAGEDGTGRGTPLVPVAHAFDARQSDVVQYGDKIGPLDTNGHSIGIVFDQTQITSAANYSSPKPGDPCHPLAAEARPPAIAFSAKDHGADASSDLAPTLRSGSHKDSHANGGVMPAVAFESRFARNGRGAPDTIVPPLKAQSGQSGKGDAAPLVAGPATHVRRLTPRECERLQGFPDNHTLVPYRNKPAADGPRYKALGNSMAVPVMAWIGRRIAMVEAIDREVAA